MSKIRCLWCGNTLLYQKYHDEEWGVPTYDDDILFEFLVLESFQAGLSWLTILQKRENFRDAFDGFNYQKIALYSPIKVKSLLQNKGIVRHLGKINSAINNAQKFIEIQKEFGSFAEYIWRFSDNKIIDNQPKTNKDIPTTNDLSNKISKDLKKRGFKFLGSTTIYAYLQAVGIINDHITTCFTRQKKNDGNFISNT